MITTLPNVALRRLFEEFKEMQRKSELKKSKQDEASGSKTVDVNGKRKKRKVGETEDDDVQSNSTDFHLDGEKEREG